MSYGFSEVAAELPTLGVGASLSFGVEPDPVTLAAHPRGPSFIEYAGAVDHHWMLDSIQALQKQGVPLLYHPSCVNLCGTVPNPSGWLRAVDEHVHATRSSWLAQDVAQCFLSPEGGYSIQLGYFVPPVLSQDSLEVAVDRVLEVREVVRAPLLLEPAPVTFQLGDMSIFEWLGSLAERTDCGLLLDAGHVVSHQLARGAELTDGLEELDLARVIELHIAGGTVREGHVYIDAHDLPVLPETWMVAREILGSCPSLRAVCVECEGTLSSSVLPMLQQARERVAAATCSEALKRKVEEELE